MKKLIVLLSLAMSASAMAADYSCGGTEPFWDLSIKGNTVTYNEFLADESTKTEEIISRKDAHGLVSEFAFEVKSASMTASIVTDATCSDGMSESTYTHAILLNVDGAVVYGCCNPAK